MNVNNSGNFKLIKQSYFQYSDPLPQREKSRVSIQFCRDHVKKSADYSWKTQASNYAKIYLYSARNAQALGRRTRVRVCAIHHRDNPNAKSNRQSTALDNHRIKPINVISPHVAFIACVCHKATVIQLSSSKG